MTQDLEFDELIDWCKKRILYLLKGTISRIDMRVDYANGWKWDEFETLIAELTDFIISRDEPEKRQKILHNIIGEDPFSWEQLIPDINIMQAEDDGMLNVKYPDGEVVRVWLNFDNE